MQDLEKLVKLARIGFPVKLTVSEFKELARDIVKDGKYNIRYSHEYQTSLELVNSKLIESNDWTSVSGVITRQDNLDYVSFKTDCENKSILSLSFEISQRNSEKYLAVYNDIRSYIDSYFREKK